MESIWELACVWVYLWKNCMGRWMWVCASFLVVSCTCEFVPLIFLFKFNTLYETRRKEAQTHPNTHKQNGEHINFNHTQLPYRYLCYNIFIIYYVIMWAKDVHISVLVVYCVNLGRPGLAANHLVAMWKIAWSASCHVEYGAYFKSTNLKWVSNVHNFWLEGVWNFKKLIYIHNKLTKALRPGHIIRKWPGEHCWCCI